MPELAGRVATEARSRARRDLAGAAIFADGSRRVEGDVLRVVDEENRKIYNVRFGDIRLARLDFEWPARRRAIVRSRAFR